MERQFLIETKEWNLTTSLTTAGFDSLSPAGFLTQSQFIVTAMADNPNFLEPWPAPVPALAAITADRDAYQEVLNDTLAGDRTCITERSQARAALLSDLLLLRLYVEMMGHGDPAKIATSGFPLRQRAPRTTAILPLAPSGFALEQGPVTRSVCVPSAALARAPGLPPRA